MSGNDSNTDTVKRGDSGLALKAGFWYVISTFLLKCIAFITIPIFSRLLSKSDYGEFANYANWLVTLLIITGAELYSSLSRAYYDYQEDYDKYISSVTYLTFFLTAICYIGFLICRPWIFNIVKIPPRYVHILFFTLLCSACKALFLTRERTLYRYKSVALISCVDTLFPTVISILLVWMSDDSSRLAMRIFGFYLPSSLIGFACACILISKGRSFRIDHCKYALVLSLPLMVHYLTISLLTSTNTIITKNIGGAELSAEVSMATSVIHILTILFQALSGALTTWLMDNLNQNNMAKIRKECSFYLAGLVVISSGVILLAPEFMLILGGARYASSISLIPGLVLAAYIQTITTIFTIILTYDKNVLKTAVFTSIAAVASIAAKVMLFPYYGIQCLPIVNIVVCSVLFFVNYLLVRGAGYQKAVNVWMYIGSALFILVLFLFSPTLYANRMIRYAVSAIGIMGVLTMLYLFKGKIFALLKKR